MASWMWRMTTHHWTSLRGTGESVKNCQNLGTKRSKSLISVYIILVHLLVGGDWNMTFIFPYTGDNHPNWLIFFRGVQTTSQIMVLILSLLLLFIWHGPLSQHIFLHPSNTNQNSTNGARQLGFSFAACDFPCGKMNWTWRKFPWLRPWLRLLSDNSCSWNCVWFFSCCFMPFLLLTVEFLFMVLDCLWCIILVHALFLFETMSHGFPKCSMMSHDCRQDLATKRSIIWLLYI